MSRANKIEVLYNFHCITKYLKTYARSIHNNASNYISNVAASAEQLCSRFIQGSIIFRAVGKINAFLKPS